MDTEQVIVVAAAAGTIVAKDDLEPDRSCGDLATLFSRSLFNNVISIRHADGSVAIYYHVKTGSLTAKNIGDTVSEGEYLGVVGSAGYSSGPHLHFEVRTASNAVVDPWQGACNPTTTVSLWKEQEPYRVKEIMDLMPSISVPTGSNQSPTCTNNVAANKPASGYVQPNLYVQPGVLHNYIVYLRDGETGDPISLRLNRPDGSVLGTASLALGGSASTSFLFLVRTIPATEPAGKWSFEATYNGITRAVPFYFNVPEPAPARIFEFHNAALDHYFRTAVLEEARSLTPASGFLPTASSLRWIAR